MKKKKIAILIFVIILVSSTVIIGTLAYLTDNDMVTNTFTIGKVDINLTEPKWNDATDGKNMVPGDTYDKDPTVAATDGESYMRIKMEILDVNNVVITDLARVDKILQTIYYDATGTALTEDLSYTLADLAAYTSTNETDFIYDITRVSNVGIRYYNYVAGDDIFSSLDGSVVLFTSIIMPTDFSNADIATLGTFSIKLTAQAIQSDNFTDASAGFTLLDP